MRHVIVSLAGLGLFSVVVLYSAMVLASRCDKGE